MNRLKIAQYIALAATAMTIISVVVGWEKDAGMILMVLGFMVALVSYLFGGLGTAIKMAGGIAKWGLIAVPFPANLMAFIMSFIVAIFVFLFLPIIPVNKAYKLSKVQ